MSVTPRLRVLCDLHWLNLSAQSADELQDCPAVMSAFGTVPCRTEFERRSHRAH